MECYEQELHINDELFAGMRDDADRVLQKLLKNMVEKDAYCTDILVQVAAVNAALKQLQQGASGKPHQDVRDTGYQGRQGGDGRRADPDTQKADEIKPENVF